jgi:hypothetical protein
MATFLVFGSSSGGGAVNVTIPSASNIAALMVWYYEDAGGSAGNAPSVPGGSSASLVDSPSWYRAGRAYIVTGLSAGSNTFTPPASGGSQWCAVVVFGDVDQTTPVGDYANAAYTTGNTITRSTPNSNEEVVLFVGAPVADVSGSAGSGSTLRGETSNASYGGSCAVASIAASGSSTNISMTASGGVWQFSCALNTAAGGGGPTTVGAQVMMIT